MSESTKAGSPAKQDVHTEEVPVNGLKGLRHWKHDLVAGIVVSLVSLPLSSGIAIASGAPPVYGLISAIIAGLIYPALGGSYMTISGPAAGLAPALVAIMTSLGGAGNAHSVGAGYYKLLVVIFMVGVLQMIIARTGLAKFAASFPAAVVEGMLAAIGVLILVKAIPLTIGTLETGHPHGFVDYVSHIPSWVRYSIQPAAIVGITTLVVMFAATSKWAKKYKIFRAIPPHLWGVAVAVPMGAMFGLGKLDPRLLIQVPANPFSGIHLPAFSEVLGDSSIWGAVAMGTVTLLLIDGVESLATAQAIDRVDPFKRTSDPDRVLFAMGLSNMVSSLLGGLTVIPGGVKSKTNIEAGGRTLWSNFVNAMMLLTFLFIAPGLISLIPTAALGGILIYTGWKMAHPAIARHMAHIGREQLVLYTITIVTTLLTDLLVGVFVGTGAKLVLLAYYARKEARQSKETVNSWALIRGMFRDPIQEDTSQDGVTTLQINAPLVCFNSYRLREHLYKLDPQFKKVVIDIRNKAFIVDHTACEAVLGSASLFKDREIEVRGLDMMVPLGAHNESIRIQNRQLLDLEQDD